METSPVKLAMNSIKWNGEFTMEDFVTEFSRNLPVVMKTLTGILGYNELHAISGDEIYWIYDILKQKRIVAAMKNRSRYLSIPINYPVQFELYSDPNSLPSKAKSLSEILPELDLASGKKYYIRAVNDEKLFFQLGTDAGNSARFGMLEVVDTYNQKYLLGHPLCENQIHSNSYAIPVYMNIEMTVASEFDGYSSDCFTTWASAVKDIVKQFTPTEIKTCQEIIIFNECPSDGTYEYINPKDFTMCEKATKELKDFSQKSNPYIMNSLAPLPGTKKPPNRKSVKLPAIPRRAPPRPPGDPSPPSAKDSINGKSSPDNKLNFSNQLRQKLTEAAKPETRQICLDDNNNRQTTVLKRFSHMPDIDSKSNEAAKTTKKPIISNWRVSMTSKPDSGGVIRKTTGPVANGCGIEQASQQSEEPLYEIVPDADFSKFSIRDVHRCLRIINLEKYCEIFEKEQVDGELLLSLDVEILTSEFKMGRFEATKLFKYINGWRPTLG